MNLSKYIILYIFSCFLFSQEYKETIAITDIMGKGISESEKQQFYDMLESALVNLGAFNVTTGDTRNKALKEVKFQQSGCVDQKCAAEVGAFLGANIMIIPSITFVKSSNSASLVLKIVDVETASIKTSITKSIKIKSINELSNSLSNHIYELFIQYIGDKSINYPSSSKQGVLDINTTPKGVNVYLNNNKVGITPVKVPELNEGTYTVVLAKSNHRISVFQVDIIGDQTKKINKDLVKQSTKSVQENKLFEIEFKFNVSDVYCSYDDLSPQLVKGSRAYYKMPEGEYTFYFKKDKYRILEEKIVLDSDKISQINLEEDVNQKLTVEAPGIISIKSNPSDAEIIINGQKIGTTPYSNILSSGKHELELRKPRYYAKLETFTLTPNESKNITLNLDPKFGLLNINSSISDAEVFIDGKGIGKTPIDKNEVKSGIHNLVVRKKLYHDYTLDFEMSDGEQKRLSIDLEPAFGVLKINASPEINADVYIDGISAGKTPFEMSECPSGTYLVELRKKDYNPTSEEITVTDKSTARKTIILTTNVGTLNASCDGCTYYLDNKKIGKNEIKEKLKAGRYILKATKPKHYPREIEVFMVIGENKNEITELEPMVGFASIFVRTPGGEDANVSVNNKKEGSAPKILTLPIGKHIIEVKHPNFVSATKEIVITENQTESVEFDLMTYGGSIQQSIDKWRNRQYIALGAMALFAGGAGGFYGAQEQAYDQYQSATTSEVALNQRDLVESYGMYRDISAIMIIPSAIYYRYSTNKKRGYEKDLKEDQEDKLSGYRYNAHRRNKK